MKRRRVVVAVGIALLLVGLYALAGFYWAPRLVADKVHSLFRQAYGRDVSLGQVRINPFTLEFEARDFSLPDADGRPMLGFGRFYFNFELSSVFHRAWTFADIEVDQPYLRLVQRPDRRLNLLDLAPRGQNARQAGSGGGIPSLRIGTLGVTGGRADIEDLARATPFRTTLQPVTFRVTDFRTAGDDNAFALTAGSDVAGRLSLHGSFGVEPFASRGEVTLRGLKAQAVSNYLGTLLPVTLPAGTVDLGFSYDFSLAGQPYHLVLDMPTLSIHDLATLARGQDTPWRYPSIEIDGTHVDVAARSVLVKSVAIDGVQAPAWIDAKGVHLPGVLGDAGSSPPTRPAGEPPAATPAHDAPWHMSVPSIQLTGLDVPFQDRRLATPAPLPFKVESASVQDFAWPIDGPLQVKAVVTSGAGGKLSAGGTVGLAPIGADLDLQLDSLDLTPIQPYLDGRTDLLFRSGHLDASGKLHLAATRPLDLRFKGRVSVKGLHTQDRPLRQDLVNWRALDLDGIRFDTRPARLEIAEVVANQPYLKLVLDPNGISNVETVLHPEAAAAKAAAIAAGNKDAGKGMGKERATAAPVGGAQASTASTTAPAGGRSPIAVGIHKIRVVDGNVNFTDLTTRPDFRIAMEQLKGDITGSSSDPSKRATVELDGKVDRYAPVHIAGTLNLLAPKAFIDLGTTFHNIELTSFNPYSTKFIGYQIDKGKLSIDAHYKVQDDRLQAEHHITVDQLEFGDKIDSPDAIGLPIKLAVALLKDANGVMDLELPVAGTVDDPQFRLGQIIWKAFVGLLTKAVTAPFKLLGSLFGGGADLSYLDFAPGSATPAASATGKIASLEKALVERPNLKLDIPWTVVRQADTEAMVAAQWDQALAAIGGKGGPDAWKTDRADYLRRLKVLYRQKNGREPELAAPPKPEKGQQPPDPVEFDIAQLEPGLKAGFTVSDADLEALAQARAEAVRDALLAGGKVDPSRVFVVRGEAATSVPSGVRMKLSLK